MKEEHRRSETSVKPQCKGRRSVSSFLHHMIRSTWHTLNVDDKIGCKLMKTLQEYKTAIVAIVDRTLRSEGS